MPHYDLPSMEKMMEKDSAFSSGPSAETVAQLREMADAAKRAGRTEAFSDVLQMLSEWEASTDNRLLSYHIHDALRRIIALYGDYTPVKNPDQSSSGQS